MLHRETKQHSLLGRLLRSRLGYLLWCADLVVWLIISAPTLTPQEAPVDAAPMPVGVELHTMEEVFDHTIRLATREYFMGSERGFFVTLLNLPGLLIAAAIAFPVTAFSRSVEAFYASATMLPFWCVGSFVQWQTVGYLGESLFRRAGLKHAT